MPFQKTSLTLLHKTVVRGMPSPALLPRFIFLQRFMFFPTHSQNLSFMITDFILLITCKMGCKYLEKVHIQGKYLLSFLAVMHHSTENHYTPPQPQQSPNGIRLWRVIKCQILKCFMWKEIKKLKQQKRYFRKNSSDKKMVKVYEGWKPKMQETQSGSLVLGDLGLILVL